MTAKTAPAPARTSVYRTREDFVAAHGAAHGLRIGNPAYTAAIQVLTHLAWRGPKGAVAWTKGTNANMVANATAMGATVGTPMPEAMLKALDALDKAADTAARKAAAKALRAATVA